MSPPKAPSQLPSLPPQGRELLDREGQTLVNHLNRFLDTFRGRSYTEADMAGSLAFQEYGTTFTIAAGVISLTLTGHGGQDTATNSAITIDTEAAAATDDLDTINGGRDGMLLFVRANNDARTVVLKNGTGNLRLQADFSLNNVYDTIQLRYVSGLTSWLEVSRSDNGA